MAEEVVQEASSRSDLPNTSTSPIPPPPAYEAPLISSRPNPKSVVLSHWYVLVPNFNTSTREFYAALDKELGDRKIPGLSAGRVEYAEGSVLSGKRQYFHLSRERLTFDICAAPFGTSYFFSCRFAESTPTIELSHILAVLIFLGLGWTLFQRWLGTMVGSAIAVIALMAVVFLFRNAAALGLKDLDAWLLDSSVFGGMYLRWVRKDTYYRQDTRLMYLESVNAITKELVQHVTGANGIHLISFKEHSPILSELYRPTTVPVAAAPKPA